MLKKLTPLDITIIYNSITSDEHLDVYHRLTKHVLEPFRDVLENLKVIKEARAEQSPVPDSLKELESILDTTDSTSERIKNLLHFLPVRERGYRRNYVFPVDTREELYATLQGATDEVLRAVEGLSHKDRREEFIAIHKEQGEQFFAHKLLADLTTMIDNLPKEGTVFGVIAQYPDWTWGTCEDLHFLKEGQDLEDLKTSLMTRYGEDVRFRPVKTNEIFSTHTLTEMDDTIDFYIGDEQVATRSDCGTYLIVLGKEVSYSTFNIVSSRLEEMMQ